MDRIRSALTGVNILIALASLALVLIVVSRIPRVRAFLATVMPKRPALVQAKHTGNSTGNSVDKKKVERERPPVSDTDSDEESERLEREAICRARPSVALAPLACPKTHAPPVIEEIETEDESNDEGDDKQCDPGPGPEPVAAPPAHPAPPAPPAPRRRGRRAA